MISPAVSVAANRMRSNWWHLVLATPIAVVVGGAFIGGGIGAVLSFFFVIPYPYAIRQDAKYVNAQSESAELNIRLYTVLGVLVLVTLGILSYIVSPYYLYKRRSHLAS